MELQDKDIYSQCAITLSMEELADKYNMTKREMFRSLIMARKVLTFAHPQSVYTDWLSQVKQLNTLLTTDDDRSIIYRILAILFFKYEAEIDKAGRTIDEFLADADLDAVQFYNHYYNEDMRIISIHAKAMDMLERRNKILFELAENPKIKPMTRIQALKALDAYINSCLLPSAPSSINVYGQALIDQSKGKQVKSFDMARLNGQNTPEFRQMLQRRHELDEIINMEQDG